MGKARLCSKAWAICNNCWSLLAGPVNIIPLGMPSSVKPQATTMDGKSSRGARYKGASSVASKPV